MARLGAWLGGGGGGAGTVGPQGPPGPEGPVGPPGADGLDGAGAAAPVLVSELDQTLSVAAGVGAVTTYHVNVDARATNATVNYEGDPSYAIRSLVLGVPAAANQAAIVRLLGDEPLHLDANAAGAPDGIILDAAARRAELVARPGGFDPQSYASGDRSTLWTVTSAGGVTNYQPSTPQNLVNGSTQASTVNAWAFGGNGASAGKRVIFEASGTVVLHAMQILSNTTHDFGPWKAIGSTDGTTWTDLTTGENWTKDKTWTFAGNTTAYRFYAIEGISGTHTNGPYFTEALFTVAADQPVSYSWLHVA